MGQELTLFLSEHLEHLLSSNILYIVYFTRYIDNLDILTLSSHPDKILIRRVYSSFSQAVYRYITPESTAAHVSVSECTLSSCNTLLPAINIETVHSENCNDPLCNNTTHCQDSLLQCNEEMCGHRINYWYICSKIQLLKS